MMRIFCPLSLLFFTIVSARPLRSYDVDSSTTESSITASLVSLLVLLALLAVKLVFIKHRQITVIRSQSLHLTSPPDLSLNSRSSLFSLKVTQLSATRYKCTSFLAILVGCLGSPAWETDLESDLDNNLQSRNERRTAPFMYQLHRQSRQQSSRSYLAPLNSHKSFTFQTPQAPPSQARLTRSMSFFSFSSDHSTEDAKKKLRSCPPGNLPLTYPTAVWPSKTTTITPQRYSLLIDRPVSRQLGDRCGASNNILRAGNSTALATTGVDLGPSLRLVGTTNVTAVPYSFLSAFPPSSYVVSPLTGTRDSLQLSRSHSKSIRKPVPPLPPLPSYSLFNQQQCCISLADVLASPRLPQNIDHFLPPLEFSPPANKGSFSAVLTKQVPTHSQNNNLSKLNVTPLITPRPTDSTIHVKLIPRVLHPAAPLVFPAQKVRRTTKHKRPSAQKSRTGIIPAASPLRIMVFPEDMTDGNPTGDTATCHMENSATRVSKPFECGLIHRSMKDTSNRLYPTTPCSKAELMGSRPLSQSPNDASSVKSTKTLARSDAERPPSDLSSLQTPKFHLLDEVDIGMLGLDRFRWSEESEELIKARSSHIKNDSVALISFWEEGPWIRENVQGSDIGTAW